MFVTKVEAQKKLCPIISAQHGGADDYGFCRGPRCMVWRWDDFHEGRKYVMPQEKNTNKEPERPDDVPESWLWCTKKFAVEAINGEIEEYHFLCWLEPEEEFLKRRVGYCGLGGKMS
jgi:hypothetical protein